MYIKMHWAIGIQCVVVPSVSTFLLVNEPWDPLVVAHPHLGLLRLLIALIGHLVGRLHIKTLESVMQDIVSISIIFKVLRGARLSVDFIIAIRP